jgi:hypothetical protein
MVTDGLRSEAILRLPSYARWLAVETTSLLRRPVSQPGPGTPPHPRKSGHELIAAGMLIMAGGYDGKPLD